MSPTSRRRLRRRRRGEDGLTLVELAIGGVLGVGLLTMVAVAASATAHSSRTEIQQGITTGNAIVAVEAVEQALSAAWAPGSTSGVSSLCAGGPDGEAWPTGSGPVVSAGPTDIVFCGFRTSSSTAHTYELHFTGCTQGLCNLALDQLGAPGCAPNCHAATVFVVEGVSDSPAPFACYTSSGGSWASTATVSQIQAVQVTLAIPELSPSGASLGHGTQVQRLVVLPNTLGGAS